MEYSDRKEESNEVIRETKDDETAEVQEKDSDDRCQSRLPSISRKLRQTK